ncbi:hypothetical protein [Persephonella sp.]
MGKTIPSGTQIIKLSKNELSLFRKALRKEDKKIFDRLFSYAKFHSQAVGNSGSINPVESIIFSILIEMEKEIQELKNGKKKASDP